MMPEVVFMNHRYPEVIYYFETTIKSDSQELRTILSYFEPLNKIGKIGKAPQNLNDIAINKNNSPAI